MLAITIRRFYRWSSDHWVVYSPAQSLTAVKLGLSPMVFSDCISLATNCVTGFYVQDAHMTMNIKLSCSYQNTRSKFVKFLVFSIVTRVVEATVTTGLSRARHCAAANGSRAGGGGASRDGRGAVGRRPMRLGKPISGNRRSINTAADHWPATSIGPRQVRAGNMAATVKLKWPLVGQC